MHRSILTMCFVAALAASTAAFAGVTVTGASDDVGGGLTRWTVTLTSTDSKLIGGMNLTFTAATMNQINPAAQPTVFENNNAFITILGGSIAQDSQFLFTSGGTGVLVAPNTDKENATMLSAAFTIPAGSTYAPFNTRAVAQVVVPNGVTVSYTGEVSYTGSTVLDQVGGTFPVPEPASLALLSLAALAVVRRRAAR